MCCFLQACANCLFIEREVFILKCHLRRNSRRRCGPMTQKRLSTVHTWHQPFIPPHFRPVAACRWHNPGNQKLRALQRKKETWGKSFPKAARGADYYHFWARLLPCKPSPNRSAYSDSTALFFPVFQSGGEVWGAERKKHPFSKQTIHTRSGKRAAAVRLV